jgi:hypothetical protein
VSWHPKRTPALRADPSGFPCPFCGSPTLRRSYGDLPEDPVRVEIYCAAPDCVAREIIVICHTRNVGGPRADLAALDAVDAGEWEPPPRELRAYTVGELHEKYADRFTKRTTIKSTIRRTP